MSQSGTLVDGFEWDPVIDSVSPSAGPTTGGTSIVIRGDFSGALAQGATVVIDGNVASDIVVASDELSIAAVTLPHAAGSMDVLVTVGGISATLAGGFDYFVATTRVPLIARGKSRSVVGLSETGGLDVTLNCDADVQFDGIRLTLATARGLFRGARLRLERAFLAEAGGVVIGAVCLFEGNVEAEVSSTAVKLSVESVAAELARTPIPLSVIQERCLNQFCDPACGLAHDAFTTDLTITDDATPDRESFSVGGTRIAGLWVDGVVAFTSGEHEWQTRAVLANGADGSFFVDPPLPSAPAAGDSISVTRACQKSPEACEGYANLDRFRGFADVPVKTEVG